MTAIDRVLVDPETERCLIIYEDGDDKELETYELAEEILSHFDIPLHEADYPFEGW